jgi:iron complex outermembrane receptor protein
MKYNVKNPVSRLHSYRLILPATMLGLSLQSIAPVVGATVISPDEIVVTARRTEEVLQNVPISMTVFNQDMLTERNVTNGADLAAYTPSLSVNTRFGADQSTFAIRGFTQELRTTSSVAVYFADVVAPRGSGSITAGDGAGPGLFFDLQNVQVLKGPQGTLFGRNTTGGAIQLVPQEPTAKTEGYLELSDGNYDMHRYQGVFNLPISDSVRARFGVDRQTRDGYLNNISGIGADRLADIDYTAGRASVMWDINDALRNYTIWTETYSRNNGSVQALYQCNPAELLASIFCGSSYNQWKNAGSKFYDVVTDEPNPMSMLRQWQVINTTTWDINDALTAKNIMSFAHLTQTTNSSVFGVDPIYLGTHISYFPAGTKHGVPTNSQKTFVEELQFQGSGFENRLAWQAGLYYENSNPDGVSGALGPSLAACNPMTGDAATWTCFPFPGVGGILSNAGTIEYKNLAAYTQSTYDITDQFRITLGLRYTVDKTYSDSQQESYNYDATGKFVNISCVNPKGDPGNHCSFKSDARSEAPTWLIDFDYLPTPDLMVYTKYARGYRQGSVTNAAPPGLESFDPEKVDAYEIGTKTTFRGPFPGTFNVAAFYNKLKDQQLQANYVPCGLTAATPCAAGESPGGSATTAIVNAGTSTIQGVEVETTLKLLESLTFNLSYTYLDTHLDSLASYPIVPGYVGGTNNTVGGHLSLSPTHTVTTGLSYRIPAPADAGDISIGGTYTFVSNQETCSTDLSPYCELPSHRLLGLSANWKSIARSPFDASFFMTNAFNDEITTYVPGLYGQTGSEYRVVGEPRMWGVRLKYNFGL